MRNLLVHLVNLREAPWVSSELLNFYSFKKSENSTSYIILMAWFHLFRHCLGSLRSKPVMVTWRDMIEWTVARPSLIINKNLLFGNRCARYFADFIVKGSLLHSLSAGSPWPAITWEITNLPLVATTINNAKIETVSNLLVI